MELAQGHRAKAACASWPSDSVLITKLQSQTLRKQAKKSQNIVICFGLAGLAGSEVYFGQLQNDLTQVGKFKTQFNFTWNYNSNEMRLNSNE